MGIDILAGRLRLKCLGNCLVIQSSQFKKKVRVVQISRLGPSNERAKLLGEDFLQRVDIERLGDGTAVTVLHENAFVVNREDELLIKSEIHLDVTTSQRALERPQEFGENGQACRPSR